MIGQGRYHWAVSFQAVYGILFSVADNSHEWEKSKGACRGKMNGKRGFYASTIINQAAKRAGVGEGGKAGKLAEKP
ncbi:MAG: hypothetical protein DSY57_06230 [Desulfobulbus sp.]|nr:MAG: hypothetical protein DSY57_06230 [Desulfobulbus sp.]